MSAVSVTFAILQALLAMPENAILAMQKVEGSSPFSRFGGDAFSRSARGDVPELAR
jgi:hypothetical protein